MLRLSVFDGDDEAYITLFDEAEFFIGCQASEYIKSLDEVL